MFTGIVEEIGKIIKVENKGKSSVITIRAKKILEGLKIGDSVSTNGVCLTVKSKDLNSFSADVMNETLNRSTLGKNLKKVNLERAMMLNGRFGGHIVSGHVDGVGKIISIKKDDNAIWYKIKCDLSIMKYIVEKGSISIDGISLTVAKIERDSFSVSVIPHTFKETILSEKSIGSLVNLENDLVGKYIEKFMTFKSKITEEFLINNEF